MKKVLLLILILVMLSGCGRINENENVSFIIDGGLPDIGEFSTPVTENLFSEDVSAEFIPSSNYGTIVPYVSSMRKFLPESDFGFDFGYSFGTYGFCTLDGRIVQKPNPKIHSVSFKDDGDGFGVYIITREADAVKCLEDGEMQSFIIPKDGSWIIDLGLNGGVYFLADGYIFTRNFDRGYENPASVYVYDYEGSLKYKFDGDYSFMNYTSGLVLTRNVSDDMYYFLSLKGEVLLGPYLRTYPFNGDGYTFAMFEDGMMYVIDKNGSKVSQKGYFNIEMSENSFTGESAFICYGGSKDLTKADILSFSGEYLGSVQNNGGIIENILLTFTENCGIIYTHNKWQANWKYLDSGERFVSKELNVCPSAIECFGGKYFFYRNDINKKGVIFDEYGNTVLSSDCMGYILDVSDDGGIIIYSEELEDFERVHVYSVEDGRDILCETGSYIGFANANDDRFFTVARDDGAYLYDADKKEFIFEKADMITVQKIDGKVLFNVISGDYSFVCDENFNVILRTYNLV